MHALLTIFIALMLCSTANAARLQSAAWADTAVVAATSSSAIPSFPVTPATAEGSLLVNAELLEADINAFSRSPENLGKHSTPALDASDFSSLGVVAAYLPFSLAAHNQGADGDQPNTATNGVASMPLMALVSLFAIGVIGMGTVGRRRHK